ncbi:hypothetical protein ACQUFY_14575 [Robbsia andropogonis]|uniref:hypothetical protein n=1 Tax=Robbsia andropogonis TaxID=28092 RepID=UPI003D1F3E67
MEKAIPNSQCIAAKSTSIVVTGTKANNTAIAKRTVRSTKTDVEERDWRAASHVLAIIEPTDHAISSNEYDHASFPRTATHAAFCIAS